MTTGFNQTETIKDNNRILFLLSLAIGVLLGTPVSAVAQITTEIVPDNTVGTIVPNGCSDCNITGGTVVNNNALFHSFEQFSVGTTNTATFIHNDNIQNIFSRVIGNSVSNIDGTIATQGIANLFFINPNGIIFGENASLNVGGSFFASTAESILFENNGQFSAVNPQNPALLTVNVPLGLQLGNNSQNIIVNPNQFVSAPNTSSGVTIFGTNSGQTLALVGNGISIESSIVQAPEGKLELWSVNNGQVNINFNEGQAQLTSGQETINFSDITITNNSRVRTTGISGSGDIQVVGENITIADSAQILSDLPGFSNGSGGNINVEAQKLLRLENDGRISNRSGLVTSGDMGDVTIKAENIEVIGGEGLTGVFAQVAPGATGNGSNLTIDTERLSLMDGGQISTATFGFGQAGDLVVKAEDITISGGTETDASQIAATVIQLPPNTFPPTFPPLGLGQGAGGNLIIETGTLQLSDGGQIAVATSGAGNAGNLDIKANTVEITGFREQGKSGLFASAIRDTGAGGDIMVTANQSLNIDDGGIINVSNFQSQGLAPPGSGTAGNIIINAPLVQLNNEGIITADTRAGDKGNINIQTEILSVENNSQISSNATENGQGGSIDINTARLNLDRSKITANGTVGAAGNISVISNSHQVFSLNQGEISASGGEGNILLESPSILLREGSLISTNGLGDSVGGNITLNSDTLIALENSDITANAEDSFGGRVMITTKSIFGTEFREELTPESDITATSDLGAEFSGIVEINSPEVDPSAGLVALSSETVDPRLIASGCTSDKGNVFVQTGRGGLPEAANQTLNGRVVWRDIRTVETNSVASQPKLGTIIKDTGEGRQQATGNRQQNRKDLLNYSRNDNNYPIIQAEGWIVNDEGKIILVANHSKSTNPLAINSDMCSK